MDPKMLLKLTQKLYSKLLKLVQIDPQTLLNLTPKRYSKLLKITRT